ncbi:hypothetical protein EZS27_003881 [termite gut metagenome]|uniref:Uncharacterized protein n=1 Tax=termite gut metagenome TaxID=433724 RepID=A0A5J4SRT7_9ZZZZ
MANSKEKKSYNINAAKRYPVVFNKKYGAFQKGDETSVTLPIAIKWVGLNVVDITDEIKKDMVLYKMDDLLKKLTEKKEKTEK